MTKKPYPSDKLDQYIVRFPNGMRDRIKAAATANSRSMNAEIIATLEEKYPQPEEMQLAEMFQIVDDLLAKAESEQERREMLLKLIDLLSKETAEASKPKFRKRGRND